MRSLVWSCCLLVALSGCDGFVIAAYTAPPAGQKPADPTAKVCDATVRSLAERPVRRLTKPELVTSLTGLFGAAVMSDLAVQRAIQQLPAQASVSNAEFDNSIIDVVALEVVAEAIVTALFADPVAVDRVLGGCPAGDLTTCTSSLVGPFATRAFRRPATPATQASIRALVTTIGGIDGLKNGVIRVVLSPHFHQHLELGVGADTCGDDCQPFDSTGHRLRLTQYEIAERLSYQLTGAPPDDALRTAAAAGQLETLDAIRQHASRLLSGTEARSSWRRVVTEWLDLHHVIDPHPAVARDRGIAQAGFGEEAREELFRFAEAEVFDERASLAGLYTQHRGVPFSPRLAMAFGVAQSSTAVATASGAGGLIARPAILLSANSLTSPILRGVFVQRKLLCQVLPDPDPNLVQSRLNDTATLSHLTLSNRELVTQMTSPQVCDGCHGIINPAGFTLERFDSAGFRRERETLYDNDGPIGIAHAIDTAVPDAKVDPARPTPAADADELMAAIADSERAQSCFAQALIVNTRFRALDTSDQCTVDELVKVQRDGRPVLDALLANAVNEGLLFKTAAGVLK